MVNYSRNDNGTTAIWGSLGASHSGALVTIYNTTDAFYVETAQTTVDLAGNWSLILESSIMPDGKIYQARYFGAGVREGSSPNGMWEYINTPPDPIASAVAVTYRGMFSPAKTYYSNERRRDVVKYGVSGVYSYHLCNTDSITGEWNHDYWSDFGSQFESVATDILLAQDAAITRSLTLGTDDDGGTAYGVIHSVLASGVLDGPGFVLANEAKGKGYFRIGTASNGSLTSGLYWNGPSSEFSVKGANFELTPEGSLWARAGGFGGTSTAPRISLFESTLNGISTGGLKITEGATDKTFVLGTSAYWNDYSLWNVDSRKTDINILNSGFETPGDNAWEAAGWTFTGVSTPDGNPTVLRTLIDADEFDAHSGTYVLGFAMSFFSVRDTSYYSEGGTATSDAITLGNITGENRSYSLSFWVNAFTSFSTMNVEIKNAATNVPIKYCGVPLSKNGSGLWDKVTIGFVTDAATIKVILYNGGGKDDGTPYEDYIYIDDVSISKWEPFTELSDKGFLAFNSPGAYIKIGSSEFELKGVSAELQDLDVLGDLTVYGQTYIAAGDLAGTTSDTFRIDTDHTSGNMDLQFGSSSRYLRNDGTNFYLSSKLYTSGDILASADNTYDIGNSGLYRFRDLWLAGDLHVDGTIETFNSVQLWVDDPTIVLNASEPYTDLAADNGGFILKAAVDKSFTWGMSTPDTWNSSIGVNLATGKEYRINGTSVLSNTTLGSNVVSSSLTGVGALTSGSIANGFGNINIGSNSLTAGLLTGTGLKLSGSPAAAIGTLRVINSGLDYYNINSLWETISLGTLTNDPTGFYDRTGSTLSFNNTNRTLTIGGIGYSFYIKGVRYTKTNDTQQIPDTVGIHYVYYNAAGTITTSTSAWNIQTEVPVATIYWTGTEGLVGDERHGLSMSGATHEWIHHNVGTSWESGLTITPGNSSFDLESGVIDDEDIEHHIIGATPMLCRVMYKTATGWNFTSAQTLYYHAMSTQLQYNNTATGLLANASANNYVACWVFATNDISTPIYVLTGQREDGNLTNARNNNTYQSLTLTGLPFAEMKLLYRILLRATNPVTYVETQDLRIVSNLPAGTYVASAHGILTGLDRDDHTQYALLAGRSGGQTFIGSTETTSGLTLQATSASGTTGSNISFKVGNAGAITALSINHLGVLTLSNGTSTTFSTRAGTGDTEGKNLWIGGGGLSQTGDGGTNTQGRNLAIGHLSGFSCTSGYWNTSIGVYAAYSGTTAYRNFALGSAALFSNVGGNVNVAIGAGALYSNNGSYNIAIGDDAANSWTGLVGSIYIGYSADATDGASNEMVLGNNAVGHGSNTVTIGNTSVTATYLAGNVTLGTQATTTAHAVRADRTLTFTSDTNVTISNSATAQNLTTDRSWTLGWTGRLALDRFATGAANYVLMGAGVNSDSAYGLIANANIAATGVAEISWAKLAAGSANYVMVTNASGYPTTEQYLVVSRGGSGTGGLTGMLKGNGANAFTTVSGVTNYVTYWSDANTLTSEQYLAMSRGGTNAGLVASDGGIVYSTSSALAILAGTGLTGRVIRSGTNSTPSWSAAVYPDTIYANNLLYGSASNVISGLATANNGVLVTNGTGVPSISTDLPTAETVGGAYIYRVSGSDVSMADGGSGASLTGVAGGLVWTNSTSTMAVTASGVAGQALVSNGATSPVWYNAGATQVLFGGAEGALASSSKLIWTDASGTLTLDTDINIIGQSDTLTLSPSGNIVLDPRTATNKTVNPNTPYSVNLGQLNKKYLSLHAAELWVETLVAQDTLATIGGRILVGPTTQLDADLTTSETNIQVKHNNLNNGDIVYMEGQGKVEFMKVTSDAVANLSKVHTYDASADSYSSNLVTSKTFSLFPVSTGVMDMIYFGRVSSAPSIIRLEIIVPAVYDATLRWEYINTFDQWTAFTPTSTTDFKTAGKFTITLGDIPVGSYNMFTLGTAYWVRCVISQCTFWTTRPVHSGTPLHTPVTYSVDRNLDSTGSNEWWSGDAVFNTGNKDNGFIDLYSVAGVKGGSTAGPTIVGNVRNSNTVYNDWAEHWAIGQLNGLYGQSSTYGVAFGKYATGAASSYVTIDANNGFNIYRRSSGGINTSIAQWDMNGLITLGATSVAEPRVTLDSSSINMYGTSNKILTSLTQGVLRLGEYSTTTPYVLISGVEIAMYDSTSPSNKKMVSLTAGVLTLGDSSAYNTVVNVQGLAINSGVTQLAQYGATTTIGRNATANQSNVYINDNSLQMRNGASNTVLADYTGSTITLGQIVDGQYNTVISADGLVINSRNGGSNLPIASYGANITIGDVSSGKSYVYVTPSAVQLKTDSNVYTSLTGGVLTLGMQGPTTPYTVVSGVELAMYDANNNGIKKVSLVSGSLTLGPANGRNVVIDSSGMSVNNLTTALASFSATNSTIGPVISGHITIEPSSITIYDASTDVGSWSATSARIGSSLTSHVLADSSGLHIKNGTTEYALFAATSEIGLTSSHHMRLNAGGITIYDDTTDKLSIASTSLRIGEITNEHVIVNSSGVLLNDGATTYGMFAATSKIGVSTQQHIEISAGNIAFYTSSGTDIGNWSTSSFRVGDVSNEHTLIDSAGVHICDNTIEYALFAATSLFGDVAGGEYVQVNGSGIEMYGGNLKRIWLKNDGSGGLASGAIGWGADGTLSASGWVLASGYMYGSTVGMSPSDYPFWAGAAYANRTTAPFRVSAAGVMYAIGATISGVITADTGKLGGVTDYWDISSGLLTSVGTGSLTMATSGSSIRVGSAVDIDTGTGVFMDGSGNFRVGTETNYFKFNTSAVSIKTSNTELSAAGSLWSKVGGFGGTAAAPRISLTEGLLNNISTGGMKITEGAIDRTFILGSGAYWGDPYSWPDTSRRTDILVTNSGFETPNSFWTLVNNGETGGVMWHTYGDVVWTTSAEMHSGTHSIGFYYSAYDGITGGSVTSGGIDTGVTKETSFTFSFWLKTPYDADSSLLLTATVLDGSNNIIKIMGVAPPSTNSWTQVVLGFITAAPTVKLRFDMNVAVQGAGSGHILYLDDFAMIRWEALTELSEKGLFVFNSPSSYMKIGSNVFELKGVDAEVQSITVLGPAKLLGTTYLAAKDLGGTTSSTFMVDTDYTEGNMDLQFGATSRYLRNDGTDFHLSHALTVTGDLYATAKHFRVPDKLNPGHTITYSATEGPENSVFLRGKIEYGGKEYRLSLPPEWAWLVNWDTITVHLTSIEKSRKLSYNINMDERCIMITNDSMLESSIHASYLIFATRKDIPKLEVYN